jgi:hypothetical protein
MLKVVLFLVCRIAAIAADAADERGIDGAL